MKRNARGLTLSEILVSLFLIGMFGLVAVGALQMALRQWGRVAQKVNASQNARFIASTIANELRQGIPWQNSTHGYLKISPPVEATAVLMPNKNTPTSTTLEFTEPHPTLSAGGWEPMKSGWASTNPNNYRNVIYRTDGGNVIRENRPHNGNAATQEVIASAGPGGSVALQFTFNEANVLDITVSATEGQGPSAYTATYTTTCFVVGR